MLSLFRSLFPSSDVRALKSALADLDGLLGRNLFWSGVRERVAVIAQENVSLIAPHLRSGKQTARQACLQIVTELLETDLTSGQDHIYRGVLSQAGAEKLVLLRQATAALVSERVLTAERVQAFMKRVEDDIREAG